MYGSSGGRSGGRRPGSGGSPPADRSYWGYPAPQWAWALYDWASSAFALLVGVLAFPLFFHQALLGPGPLELALGPLRVAIAREAVWPYIVALGLLLTTAVVIPLALWSDRAARRRLVFVGLFVAGCLGTAAMAYLRPGALAPGIVVFVVAELGYAGSFVYYNAFLPMLSAPAERDRVSSLGVAAGYAAGIVLLAAAALLFELELGAANPEGLRRAFLFATAWWALFTVPLLRALPAEPPPRRNQDVPNAWAEAVATFRRAVREPDIRWFIIAFLAGSQGMLTILTQVAPYAQLVLGATAAQLAWTLLASQVAGAAGAFAFLRAAQRWDTRRALMGTFLLWTVVAAWGAALRSVGELYLLAVLAGLALGGSLALSRSYYTRFFSVEQATLWFSLSLFGTRFGALAGPVVYGLVVQWTGSLRLALLSVVVFFVIALLALARVREVNVLQD